MTYATINKTQLRTFVSQKLCSVCGNRMVESKREKGKFACRSHPDIYRLPDQITNERKFFELIRQELLGKNIKGIMVHELDPESLNRGQIIDFSESDILSNPSYSLPIGLVINYLLIKLRKKPHEYIEILKGETGVYGHHWRIVNPDVDADWLTLIARAISIVSKGVIIGDYVVEAIHSESDFEYALNAEIARTSEADQKITVKYDRPMPSRI